VRTIVLAMLTISSPAFADAIGPPEPLECPAGSFAATNHCGTVCTFIECEMDDECPRGETCAVRSLCTEEIPCGGWGGTYTIVHGDCVGGCSAGSCNSVRSCGASSPDAGMGRVVAYGCACRAGGTGTSPLAWLLTLPAIAVLRRR
jgi:MYXO-CTERM domain-containing protein